MIPIIPFKQLMTNRCNCLLARRCGFLWQQFFFLIVIFASGDQVNAQINMQFSLTEVPLKGVIPRISSNPGYAIATSKVIILKPSNTGQDNEYILHGKVTDSVGVGLPGASVKIKGKNKYVTTDGNGQFNLYLSDQNNTLEISYVGYLPAVQRFDRASASRVVTIRLKSNASLLAEVVVNGFQSLTKERSTAAIVSVDNKLINQNIPSDILSALEGRVAGLAYVKNVFGQGLDRPVLRGQGTFSLTGVGTEPLIVIDGLPSETTLDQINPYDIESVSVLKDGAAASIYGSRSANGVIVLTTKKGNSPVKISLNTDFFVDTKPNFKAMHYASTSDMIDLETDVFNKERARYATTESMFAYYGDVANGTIRYYTPLYQLYRDRDAGRITPDQVNQTLSGWKNNDYYDQYRTHVWQNAFRQRYNLSLSSATDKSNTFSSVNYENAVQRIVGNKNQRLNLYFKNSYQVSKWLSTTIGFNGSYTSSVATDGTYDSYTDIQPRYASIVNPDGSLVYADWVNLPDGAGASGAANGAIVNTLTGNRQFKSYGYNILESLDEGKIQSRNISLRAFASIQARIITGLDFSSQLQYERATETAEAYYSADAYKMRIAHNALVGYNQATNTYSAGLPSGGRFNQTLQHRNSYTFRNQLSYNKGFFNGKHLLSAIGGFEMRETSKPRGMTDIRYGYDPVTLSSTLLNNAAVSQTGLPSYIYGGNKTIGLAGRTQFESLHRFLSAYANAGYTYLNKYNLTGSLRVDQADLFGAHSEFKNRPLWSVGLGWNVSNEGFLKAVNWISLLKFRTTYGINGNQNTSTSKYLTARRLNDNLFPSLQYIDIVGLPNPKLRWEKTETYNAGMDYALFSNRLRGSIDVYYKKSTDLIVNTELDPTVGAASRAINNGVLANKGIEFSLGGDWLRSGGLTLSSTFILSFNSNKIGKVNNALSGAYSYVASPMDYYIEGSAYNALYAYRYGGMVNGYPYFLDQNGKASLTFDSSSNPVPTSVSEPNSFGALINMGSLTPLYNGSFSQRASFKDFELAALFIFSGGNVMRKDVMSLSDYNLTGADITTQRYKNGSSTDLPRLLVDYAENMINSSGSISRMWQFSDVNVLKGDYIKLRSISLSYNLPQDFIKKYKIPTARFTAQVNNLWYASAAGEDIDPESYALNTGTRTLQDPRSFVFGLNLTF